MVDVREARGREVLDLGQRHRLPGKRSKRAADDHDQAQRAGVDDARVGKHLQLLGRVANRLLAREECGGEHLGE